jgi:hypothetical protein
MPSATFRPEAMARTTKLAPEAASPAAKTLSTLLRFFESMATFLVRHILHPALQEAFVHG